MVLMQFRGTADVTNVAVNLTTDLVNTFGDCSCILRSIKAIVDSH